MRSSSLMGLALLPLLLAGCWGASATARYELTIDPNIPEEQRNELIAASARVLQRRAEALGGEVKNQEIVRKGSGVTLVATLSDAALHEPLDEGLTGQFSFDLMRSVNPGETADITVEKFGGFKQTGITEDALLWLRAGSGSVITDPAHVGIIFTPEGRGLVEKVFAEQRGKTLAIFVRERLISTITSPGNIGEVVVINGVPSYFIAKIFVDDVNVGRYVQFTPLP